jgi:hypothetical protein
MEMMQLQDRKNYKKGVRQPMNNTNNNLTEGERAGLRRLIRYGVTIFVAVSITLVIVALASAALPK